MTQIVSDTIPVVVLTGFLGAGKTTLLNALLSDPRLRDTAVIVNEFGEIAIDHNLVKFASADLVVTTTGCLCCSASSDVGASLVDLLEARDRGEAPPFARVIVETTGLADPAPLVNRLTPGALPAMQPGDETVAERFRLAAIVACFDVLTGAHGLQRAYEAVKQVAFASTIVLTKSDLASSLGAPCDIEGLTGRLAQMNPSAKIVGRADVCATFADLFLQSYVPSDGVEDIRGWLALDRMYRAAESRGGMAAPSVHAEDIRTISLVHDGPVTADALDMFLMLLSSTAGAGLLRMKGIVRLSGEPDRPVVIHAVQHLMHPPIVLPEWPSDDRRTRVVVIGRGHDEKAVAELFRILTAREERPAKRGGWPRPVVAAVALMAAIIALCLLRLGGLPAMAAIDRAANSASGALS